MKIMRKLTITLGILALTVGCGELLSEDQATNESEVSEINSDETESISRSSDFDYNREFPSDGQSSKLQFSLTYAEGSALRMDEEVEGEEISKKPSDIPKDDKAKDKAEEDKEDEAMVKGCSEFYGKDRANIIRISGSKQVVDITPSDIIAIKITGNKNLARLVVGAPSEDEEVSSASLLEDSGEAPTAGTPAGEELLLPKAMGICVWLAGNQPKVEVDLSDVMVGKLGVVSRGNQASTDVKVNKGAEIVGLMTNFRGNKGSLTISGEGDYPCPNDENSSIKSLKHTITCEEK
jgi:hypothetical protein